MARPIGGAGSAEAFKFPGVPKQFTSRQAAIDFLSNSPKYVGRRAKFLARHFPGLLKQSGYRARKEGAFTIVERREASPVQGYGRAGAKGRGATWSDVGRYRSRGIGARDGSPPKGPLPKDRPKIDLKPRGTTKPAANGSAASGAPGALDAAGLGMPTIDVGGLGRLDPNTGRIIPISMADDGAIPLNASKFGETMAGLQFDPVIADLAASQQVGGRQNKQNERDIANWYQQVLGSQATAAQRDAAIGRAGEQSVSDATQAIVSSLGGSANQGSGMVGAAGASAANTLDALGVAQDQYNADIRPLLQAEKSGALSRERAMGTGRLHDLAVKLASARGQRGQAQAAAQFQAQEANNQILDNQLQARIGIINANNSVRQQRFNNAFGQEQAKIAASISGGQLINDTLKALTPDAGEARTVPYAKAPQSTRDDAYASFEERIAMLKESGYTAQDAMRAAGTFFPQAYGWSLKNPAVANLARQAIRSVFGV